MEGNYKKWLNRINVKLDKGTYTGTASDLKAEIDNIQIGGRNLITKLSKEKSYPAMSFWEYFPLSEKLKEGETYILNGTVENVGGLINIGLNNFEGYNNYLIDLPINIPFVANNEMANRTHFSIANQTGVGTSIFKRFKLEKGNKATDWTPAPEDKQDRLQDITGNIGVGKPDSSATEKLDVNGNVKSNSYKFNLQASITPTPNTLVPKTDGSGLLWYDNNSVLRNIGENLFSADLSSSTARNHSLNASFTIDTKGNAYSIKNLPNKNTDISNFRKVRVQNTNGLDAVVDSKNMLLDMPSYLTEEERTNWKTAMNGGWTTNTMSISTIVPFLIPFGQDVNTTVFITGANLNLPPTTFTVEILDINNNVVATVPNNQVNLVNSGNLNFYFNFKNLPIAEYKIRLWNGVAYYTSVPKFKIVDVSNITNIDFGLAGWDVLKQDTDTTTQVYGNSLTIAEVGTVGSLVTSLLSGKFAEANENFVIELVIQATNKNTQYTSAFFKIGLTDGNTANSLVSNQFLFYGLGKTVYSQLLLRYLNSGSSREFGNGSSTSSYSLKLTIIKQDNQLILIDSLGNGSFATLLNSSGYKLSVQMIATGNSESLGVNIVSAYKI